MGLFTGVRQAKASRDGDYVQPGNYVARIDRVKKDKNRFNNDFVAVEMTVLHVIAPDNDGHKPHTVGESISRVFSTKGEQAQYFLGEVKSFVAAAFGCAADEVTEDACEAICDPAAQPLKDTVVEIMAKARIGKKAVIDPKTGKMPEYTITTFKRRVRPSELAGGLLTKGEIDRFYPRGALDALIAAEQAEDAENAKTAAALAAAA